MSQSLLLTRRFGPFFWTQALGAFNDNVVKNALIILVTFGIASLSEGTRQLYVNLAAGIFILPFFLFSATCGQIAEKYEKGMLIRRVKLLEVGIACVAAVGFALHSPNVLLGALFLLGCQATMFGPIKYSILPQSLKPEELVGGNAWVGGGTFVAILLGTLLGGWLILLPGGALWAGAACIGLALAGWGAAHGIPLTPATAPGLVVNWNPLTETFRNIGFLRSNQVVFNSVLGISWFWFYGAVFLSQLPSLVRDYLGGAGSVVTLMLAMFSIGVGVGALLCERLSGGKVELGLVPLGSIGLTVFGADLYFAMGAAGDGVPAALAAANAAAAQTGATIGTGWEAFVKSGLHTRLLLDLSLCGVFGGFYIVPLYALIQARTPPAHRSRVIAGNNILNAAFMVAAAASAIGLLAAGLSVPQLLLTLGLMNAAVAVYIYTLVPEFLVRFLVWGVIGLLYRIRVRGYEHIPEEGATIVAANHTSLVDVLVLGGLIRRPVRFVSYYKIYELPWLKPLFKAVKVIPIAQAKEDPAILEAAFVRMGQVLDEGDVLGIFPEGKLTPDGTIQPFRGGIGKILDGRKGVQVVPVAVRGLWDSMWSRRDQAMGRARLPRRFRAHVDVVFGVPIPGEEVTAERLEAEVRALLASLPPPAMPSSPVAATAP